jgi:hypothetical protein
MIVEVVEPRTVGEVLDTLTSLAVGGVPMEQSAVNQGGRLLARLARIPAWPYPWSRLWGVGFGGFLAISGPRWLKSV